MNQGRQLQYYLTQTLQCLPLFEVVNPVSFLMEEVDTPDDEIISNRCCSSVEEVTGRLATLSASGADDGEPEEEILYAIGDYTGVGEDQVKQYHMSCDGCVRTQDEELESVYCTVV